MTPTQTEYRPAVTTLLEDLVEDATDVHVAVENRNIEALYTFDIIRLLEQDCDGETALHYAAINDDLEICKILINRNREIVGIKDVEDKTAYDWACEYNNEYKSHNEICEFLKKYE